LIGAMAFFRNIVFVAVLAGLASGLVMTALQFATTVPLIIKAESYERAAQIDAHAALPADRAHGHSHEDTAWAPKKRCRAVGLFAMTSVFAGWSGMGTQLVGTQRMSAPCSAASR
jgi:predicted cobalt transporter CbtA